MKTPAENAAEIVVLLSLLGELSLTGALKIRAILREEADARKLTDVADAAANHVLSLLD